MGDLIYALPVLRALARLKHDKIHLMTSGMVVPMVPLLWEQPYIDDVDVDPDPYEIDHFVFPNWEYYKNGDGYNLSLQPKFYEPNCPASWTFATAWIAEVEKLEPEDKVVFPTLLNHRRWTYGVRVVNNGGLVQPTRSAIVAPECETLDMMLPSIWQQVINTLAGYGPVIVVGMHPSPAYSNCVDMRGLTTVPTLARMIAEASFLVGAHSLPWHLARHSEVPAICFQSYRPGLLRCIPVDTGCNWIQPDKLQLVLDRIHYHFMEARYAS